MTRYYTFKVDNDMHAGSTVNTEPTAHWGAKLGKARGSLFLDAGAIDVHELLNLLSSPKTSSIAFGFQRVVEKHGSNVPK